MNGIPVLTAHGTNIPDTWEQALLSVYRDGCSIATQYDKPNDPPSKDCSMLMVVENPMEEPLIHRCFPGQLKDLGEYVAEVIEGTNDNKIAYCRTKDSGHLYYTYHSRLFNYCFNSDEYGVDNLNQIEEMIQQLAKVPYTRRAQAITWNIREEDYKESDPPCLQSIFCRMTQDEHGTYLLNMNTRWRSRDAYRAAQMNMFALVHLQKYMAEKISNIMGQEVKLGRYVDMSDSFHIYGNCLEEFNSSFIKALKTRSFAARTWRSDTMSKYIWGK